MKTHKKLQLHKETIAHLTTDELAAANGGTLSPVMTTIQYTPQVQQFTQTVSNPCGKLAAAKNWWDNGGKQFVSRALCTAHCPLSTGMLTGNC